MERQSRRTDRQRELPLSEAEGSYDERRNRLGLALIRVNADLYLRDFMLWIFNVTDGGIAGSLKKSINEIMQHPWGLCCSKSKARSTVETAAHYKWIVIERTYSAQGDAGPNSYAINWPGIRASLNTSQKPGSRTNRIGSDDPGGWCATDTTQSARQPTSSAAETTSYATEHSFKEYSSPNLLSELNSIPPSTERTALITSDVDRASTLESSGGRTTAERKFLEAGAENAREIVERLQLERRSLAEALQIARVLRANRTQFRNPGGAAWFYLDHGRWPINTLVDPDEFERQEAAKAVAESERRRADDRRRRELEERERREADLQERFGKVLDDMSDTERDAAAERLLIPMWLKKYRQRGSTWSAELRSLLIRELAAEAAKQEATV